MSSVNLGVSHPMVAQDRGSARPAAAMVVGGRGAGGLGGPGGIPASCNAAGPYPCQHDRMPLRCLLVDDNEAFLEAAGGLLEREGLTVAGVASSTAEALQQARRLRPDVVLVDIGLGDESGFDLARL